MKTLLAITLATLATASTATATDFEAYGYLNSARDVFTPIDGYTYSPLITILDVSSSSPIYGWLTPAHSGSFVGANAHNQPITISGPSFDEASFWIRAWLPGHAGTAQITTYIGLTEQTNFEVVFEQQWTQVYFSRGGLTGFRVAPSDYIFLDDINFSVSTIPEPLTSSLLLAGMSVLALRSKCHGRRR